jgi:hypothetical protein
MVLKGAPGADFAAALSSGHKRVVEEGAQLRAALPVYLKRWRDVVDAHCPILAQLRDLVRSYIPEPTTTDELWATGLGAAAQLVVHADAQAEAANIPLVEHPTKRQKREKSRSRAALVPY